MPKDYKLSYVKVHDSGITCAHLENNVVVTGSYDRSVRVLDLENMQFLTTLWGHKNAIRCVQLVGSVVLSGSNDCSIRIWNCRTGECIHELTGHKGPVTCLQLLDDGYLITGSMDHTLKVWDIHSGKCLDTFQQAGPIECLKAVGEHVAVAIRGGHFSDTLYTIDHTTGERIRTFENEHWVKSMLFDGKRLITGHCFPYVIKSWDLATGKCEFELTGHQGPVCSLQFQNNHLLSGAKEDNIRIWNMEQRVPVRFLEEQKHVSGIQFQQGRLLTWSETMGSLLMWQHTPTSAAPSVPSPTSCSAPLKSKCPPSLTAGTPEA